MSLRKTLTFDAAIEQGSEFIGQMSLDTYSDDFDTAIRTAFELNEDDVLVLSDRPFTVTMELLNYLTQLTELQYSDQLDGTQWLRIENLKKVFYMMLADKYYEQSMAVLREQFFLPTGKPRNLIDQQRIDFFNILTGIETQRDELELDTKKISDLCKALDPNNGELKSTDTPIPAFEKRGNTSLFLLGAFGEQPEPLQRSNAQSNLLKDMLGDESKTSLHDEVENSETDEGDEDFDFRDPDNMSYEKFSISRQDSERLLTAQKNKSPQITNTKNNESYLWYAYRKIKGVLATFSLFRKCCSSDSAMVDQVSKAHLPAKKL